MVRSLSSLMVIIQWLQPFTFNHYQGAASEQLQIKINTMSPQEKAINLIAHFISAIDGTSVDAAIHAIRTMPLYGQFSSFETARQCALIAVVQVINANPHTNPFNTMVHSNMKFWLDVKTQIKKL